MNEKQLRKLSRLELLELLVAKSQEVDQLKAELSEANARLASRKIQLEETGNIAQAALALNGVFEAAQAAADQYLENIQMIYQMQANRVMADYQPETGQGQTTKRDLEETEKPEQTNQAEKPDQTEKTAESDQTEMSDPADKPNKSDAADDLDVVDPTDDSSVSDDSAISDDSSISSESAAKTALTTETEEPDNQGI